MSSVAVTETESAAQLQTHGQRRINLIWESTQAVIALAVTVSTLFVSSAIVLRGQSYDPAFLLLSNGFFLVIGFYFGRTNHTRQGGVEATR